jgi:hypothetical protein
MTAAERRFQPTLSATSPRIPQNAVFMLAAYLLSVVYTATTVINGTDPAGFGANDPLTYGFYLVSIGFFFVALSERRGAQIAVAAYLVLQLATGVLVYPDDFGPAQQTTWGWFENDAYMSLLAVALYLTVRGLTRSRR